MGLKALAHEGIRGELQGHCCSSQVMLLQSWERPELQHVLDGQEQSGPLSSLANLSVITGNCGLPCWPSSEQAEL